MLLISLYPGFALADQVVCKPKHRAQVEKLCQRNPSQRSQCCAEHYLGERNEELLKLLSPLHKLSENKSASFPSP